MIITRTCAFFLIAVATVCFTSGCKRSGTPADNKAGKDEHKHGPGHEHGAGPHGGAVADWGGGKYHVEFTVDHDKQEATVYVLGSDEETPVPIKAKDDQVLLSITEPTFQVVLKATPEKGDPMGKSSRFTGTHEKLGKVQEFAGSIIAEVDGTPYSGDFKETPAKK